MYDCLTIDVTNEENMFSLVRSSGEVLIDPYEVNYFTNLFNRIKKYKLYSFIKQSGKTVSINGPISKFGNKHMRKILFIDCSNIITIVDKTKK